MMIAERILLLLEEGPKSTKYIQEAIPDKHSRVLAATISNNSATFLRLEKGLVGLKNRDEHLMTGKETNNQGLAIHKKIVNLLVCGPMKLENLYRHLPEEKQVSIRATISMYPDVFIRVKQGLIGRTNRDEYLREKYSRTEVKEPRVCIVDMLEMILNRGPKRLDEIFILLPEYPRKSITSKLSLNKKFKRVGSGVWELKERSDNFPLSRSRFLTELS